MSSITRIAFYIIGLGLAVLIAFSVTSRSSSGFSLTAQNLISVQPVQDPYRFKDPRLAYKILGQLDVFKPVDNIYFKERYNGTDRYEEPMLGLKNDDGYCDKHRLFVAAFPESVFEEMNFVMSSANDSWIRDAITKPIGNDVMPYVGAHMKKKLKETRTHDIEPYANIFFTTSPLHQYKHVGKHFACLTQAYNHIPGHRILTRKDAVATATIEYAKQFENRPQCFSYDKFFPKTWILYEKQDCLDFFEKFNSQEYQEMKKERRIVYIRKVGAGVHKAKGVEPVNDAEEAELRSIYDNGKKCGKVTKNYLIQNFIHNPLLINGHKFDFRMFMLVASTNPLIAYYHDGGLRVTLNSYDINSDEKNVLLTNFALNKQYYEDAREGNYFRGLDEEGIRLAQQWTFDRLLEYLLEKGIVTDPNWLDNYLRPEFKKAMIHLVRISAHSLLKSSSIYELYGLDFMLDENMNLWFVEANAGPAFKGYSKPTAEYMIKMLQDHYKVVMGLTRSRMKRMVRFVNELIDSGDVEEEYKGKVVIKDLQARIEAFENITQNYFEEEFEPSPDNGFAKIIDANYKGVEMYQGYVSEECI